MRSRRQTRPEHGRTAAAVAFSLLLASVAAFAGGGIPDDSFGAAGFADVARATLTSVGPVAETPCGALLVAGTRLTGPGAIEMAVTRLDARGAVDPTFGAGGIAPLSVPGARSAVPEDLQVLADGSYLVAGYLELGGVYQVVLAHFGPDGSPDLEFGSGGRVLETFGGVALFPHLATEADGSIYLGASVRPAAGGAARTAVAKYTSDGYRDEEFGRGGVEFYAFGGEESGLAGLAVSGDGKLVLVGSFVGDEPDQTRAVVLRLFGDGSPDPSFGSGGRVSTAPPGASAGAQACAFDAGGRLLIAGYALSPEQGHTLMIARFKSDGALDTQYGDGGFSTLLPPDSPSDRAEWVNAIEADSAGGAILGGAQYRAAIIGPGVTSRAFLGRVGSDGRLDSDFGAGGFTILEPLPRNSVRAVAELADGRIAAALNSWDDETGAARSGVFVSLADPAPTWAFADGCSPTFELKRGSRGTIDIGLVRRGGHSLPMTVSVSVAAGARVKLSAPVGPVTGSTVTLSYRAKKKAPLGELPVEITVSDGRTTRTLSATVRIEP